MISATQSFAKECRPWGVRVNAVLFLASDGARCVTGTTLTVDGGYLR